MIYLRSFWVLVGVADDFNALSVQAKAKCAEVPFFLPTNPHLVLTVEHNLHRVFYYHRPRAQIYTSPS